MHTRQTMTVVQLDRRIVGLLVACLLSGSSVAAQEQPVIPAGEESRLASPVPDSPAEVETPSRSSDADCHVGTVRDPRSHRCLHVCSDGRLEVAPGFCCWPGQDVGESTRRCVGAVAYCPGGTIPNPGNAEECLRLCPGGKLEVAGGHCCWPGQSWREETRKCEGRASCPRDTVADPRDSTECLRRCSGNRVEVAPGHCCWPGQAWNIDTGECEGPALACTANMRLSPAAACVPLDRLCETSLECSDDSVCLAGRCEPGRRFRRLEIFAEGVPVVLGYWSVSDTTSYGSLASGTFFPRGALGLALRASWSIHPRWSAGGYLGYLRAADRQVDVDQGSSPDVAPSTASFRMVRLGGLVNYRWSRHRSFVYGLGLDAGAVIGTAGGGEAPFGLEVAPDVFVDLPLGSDPPRPYLTLSFGFRAGAMDHGLPDNSNATERWYYFMPLLRLGFGMGH